ncbi:MAG: MarR family winged helix-turn-helix transcriptional regulator [Lysobacterales bacterium]
MNGKGKLALLAWLDLLRSANRIKKIIDGRLKAEFGQSISRFDALSALQRASSSGIRAGELSRMLVVSEGNITQLMGKLVRDNLVSKHPHERDARVVIYQLSDTGAVLFTEMAKQHRRWITELFSGLNDNETSELRALLEHLSQPPSTKEPT